MKLRTLLILLAILKWGGLLSQIDTMFNEKIDNMHYLDVMEPISLEVLAETMIGEFQFKSHKEFELECFRRLKLNYSEAEILKLKENIPSNFKPKYKTQTEILNDLIIYNENIFIPKTLETRNNIFLELEEDEKIAVKKLRSDYSIAVDNYLKSKLSEITSNAEYDDSKKMKKIEELKLNCKLYKTSLTFNPIWNKKGEEIKILSKISKKYAGLIEQNEDEYFRLLKDRFKIRIGKLGNIMGVSISSNADRESLITWILNEFLIIE